jgi:hypothetical protein
MSTSEIAVLRREFNQAIKENNREILQSVRSITAQMMQEVREKVRKEIRAELRARPVAQQPPPVPAPAPAPAGVKKGRFFVEAGAGRGKCGKYKQ